MSKLQNNHYLILIILLYPFLMKNFLWEIQCTELRLYQIYRRIKLKISLLTNQPISQTDMPIKQIIFQGIFFWAEWQTIRTMFGNNLESTVSVGEFSNYWSKEPKHESSITKAWLFQKTSQTMKQRKLGTLSLDFSISKRSKNWGSYSSFLRFKISWIQQRK